MAESLQGRVAIVTGGGSGIGRSTCLALASCGAKIAIVDINFESAEETAYPQASVLPLKCDVSSETEVRAMVASTAEKFGRLDCAVNNAGIGGEYTKTAEYSTEAFDKLVEVNLRGVFLCMKSEINQFLQQEKARHYSIVNVSSIAGLVGMRLNSPYSAVKHGVVGFTKSTALEYARQGIRVNAVCPSFVVTPMVDLFGPSDSPMAAKLKNAAPLGRLGQPEEVAAAIIWLLSDAASFTTGFAMALDGGLSAY